MVNALRSLIFMKGPNHKDGPGTCMGDNSRGITAGLSAASAMQCTGTDVRIAQIMTVGKTVPVCEPGTIMRGQFQALLESNTDARRHDIGIWMASNLDSDPMTTGQCSHHWFLPGNNPSTGKLPNFDGGNEGCGDLEANESVMIALNNPYPLMEIPCVDNDGDGFVEFEYCVSWNDPEDGSKCSGGNYDTDYRISTVPGDMSKCNCGKVTTVSLSVALLSLFYRVCPFLIS